MSTSQPTVGELIQRKRLERGLSARALSLAAGQSPSYVTKLESGHIAPSLTSFGRIAAALGLNQAEVFFAVHCEALRSDA